MSLLLAGLVFASTSGALMVGRWIKRRRDAAATPAEKPTTPENADARTDAPKEPATPPGTKPKKAAPKPTPEGHVVDGLVCQLGDVVMRMTGEEAWLAGGVVLSEEVPLAVLFVAPDAGHDCAIYARIRPRSSLVWLEPVDAAALLVGGEPPSAVEHGGVRFERARRLPLRPRRIGVGAPDVGDAVVVAEYTSAGSARLLVLKGNSGKVHAYRGLELEEGMFEVIASGDATLES